MSTPAGACAGGRRTSLTLRLTRSALWPLRASVSLLMKADTAAGGQPHRDSALGPGSPWTLVFIALAARFGSLSPANSCSGVPGLGPRAASLGSMAPAHLAEQGPGAAAQPASAAQARKDTATHRKDLRKQSLSTVRLQTQDGLSRSSTSDGLELQMQDLTPRCAGQEAAPPLPCRPRPRGGHPHRAPRSGRMSEPGPASDPAGSRGSTCARAQPIPLGPWPLSSLTPGLGRCRRLDSHIPSPAAPAHLGAKEAPGMWGRPPQESGKGEGKPAGQTKLGQPQLGPSTSPHSSDPGPGRRGVALPRDLRRRVGRSLPGCWGTLWGHRRESTLLASFQLRGVPGCPGHPGQNLPGEVRQVCGPLCHCQW